MKLYCLIYFLILLSLIITKENLHNINKNFLADLIYSQELTEHDERLDVNITFEEIVTKKGYPLSSYLITTSDGYILKLYRIPGSKGQQLNKIEKDPLRKVVLLQHGLLDSSDSWVANYEAKSLPFILANKGYDVWLGNNRGNKYSRNHKFLDPNKNKEFWKFSLHEMGTLDLPAMVDFIIETTGRQKISYVSHSQGSTQLFAALTLDCDYFSQRINAFLAFGPVTNVHNAGSTFLKLLAKTNMDILFEKLNIFNELLNEKNSVRNFQTFVCNEFGALCNGVLESLADANIQDDDMDRYLVFLSKYPSGASLRTIHHFADNLRNNRFAQLDEKFTPYNLENIKNIPISLFVGKDDLLATVKDNLNLKDILSKNGVLEWYKEYNMGHGSFLFGKEINHINDTLPILEKYNS